MTQDFSLTDLDKYIYFTSDELMTHHEHLEARRSQPKPRVKDCHESKKELCKRNKSICSSH